jgi:hypothetical protein
MIEMPLGVPPARLRPRLAASASTGDMNILAVLCAYPSAYYAGTLAGTTMCPTDDAIAYLMIQLIMVVTVPPFIQAQSK